MKKILIAALMAAAMTLAAHATHNYEPCITCPPGETGATGDKGDKGDTGAIGRTGADGTNGNDGAAGQTGATGLTGAAGATGPAGADGIDGLNGTNGLDGLDGSITYIFTVDENTLSQVSTEVTKAQEAIEARIDAEVRAIQEEIKNATEYANDVVAMNQATAAIDFGTAAKGSFEMGVGFGYSSSYAGNGKAGALGFKYGTSETTAIVVKGARSFNRSDTYAIGLGGTVRF